MSKNLTARQEEIINFIDRYFKKNNFPPTLKEIGENFKITLKGSFDHIKALQKKGFITYTPKKSRSISLVRSGLEEKDVIEIPILGTVQAGLPIMAYENFETTIKMPANMFGNKGEIFGLRVRGDSMIDECIKEGDIAIIKSTPIFENGEIIVVDTGSGITIKKGYKDKDNLRLEAANKNYNTILTKKANILGKLIGILRNY